MSFLFNLLRAVHILLVLSFYGVFFGRHKGKRIVQVFFHLGPSYIKLGQMLSTRPDIVGKHVASDLIKLQDKLPAISGKKAIQIVEKDLGGDIDNFFKSFDQKAIAAASIAQVHHAITIDDIEVAVKILRPNARKSFTRDIALFYWGASILDKFKSFKRLRLKKVVRIFEESMQQELDLRMEAASASALKENCRNDKKIYIPKIFWQYTNSRILTIEWVKGFSIYEKEKMIEHGIDPKEIAKNISNSFFNQAYRDGFFHADLHPGNIFIDYDGNIVPVDFGIMGYLDQETKIYVAEIMRGFVNRDYDHVANVHFEAGYVPADQNKQAFAIACRALGEPIMEQPLANVSIAKLLGQLFKVSADFKMETQPQLLLLQKTMVLVESIGSELDSKANMWKLAEPWMHDWAKKNLGLEAIIRTQTQDILSSAKKIPTLVQNLEQIANNNKNGIQLSEATIKELRKRESPNIWCYIILALAAAVVLL